MMIRLGIAVLLILWGSLPVHAEEGFFSEPTLPPGLRDAWEATFQIIYKDGEMGTAFVINKQPVTTRRVRLLFLTSGHVVHGQCRTPFGPCPNIKTLSASEGYHTETRNSLFLNHRDWTFRGGAVVVDYDLINDLALLEVVASADKYQDLRPIPRANCRALRLKQPVYVFGFPRVTTRTAPGSVKMSDREHMIRRWSQGHVEGRVRNKAVREEDQQLHYWLGTTADALPGGSGGPGLTADGHYFGVLHSILVGDADDGENGYMAGKSPWHSHFSNCKAVERFLTP